jgi:hypothetical protein
MQQSVLDYFRARARAERELADSASSEEVALIHKSLAVGYEQLVQPETPLQRPTLRIRAAARGASA